MSLSFTRARVKYVIAKITQIWWLYIALTAGVLYIFYIVLLQENLASQERVREYKLNQETLQQHIMDLDEYFERLVFEVTLVNQRATTNTIRRDRLHDLLGLVPDKITLHVIEISDDTLLLKGITPSREFFYFALQDPLKANFGRSNVTFYALPNGWYEFTSISYATEKKPAPPINAQSTESSAR